MKKQINNLINKFGYQINRYPHENIRKRIGFLNRYKINKVFDVGANEGQYAMTLRKYGYGGEIVSFEPLSSAFEKLKLNSKNDEHWKVFNYALGNTNGETLINISGNSYSSSISEMTDTHLHAEPDSHYIGKEHISIKKLDTIINEFSGKDDRMMLKIDTQGYEKNVIDGAIDSLPHVIMLQVEMALVPLYNGEFILPDISSYLYENKFKLINLENGFTHPETSHLLQVDGIFINTRFSD